MREPWYYRRLPPIFCNCCRPFYEAVRPIKNILLIVSIVIWLVGALMLLAIIFTCTVVYKCEGVAAILVPLGVLFIWLGYMFFHCAWAAQLLDEPDTIKHSYNDTEGEFFRREPTEESPFEVAEDEVIIPTNDPRATGYWRFVGDDPWQAKCSRDALQ